MYGDCRDAAGSAFDVGEAFTISSSFSLDYVK